MDLEERLPTTPRMAHLSDEQQARMTQNLSAAKAILARKQTQSPASPVEALMHGKPVSPANRNRAAQPSERASSFKRKLESSPFADGPLQDLAVNTARELSRKEKHGGRMVSSAHSNHVLSGCVENRSDCRQLSSPTLSGGTKVVRQSVEAWGSTCQVTGSLLQQGASQTGHSAALGIPGQTLQSSVLAQDAHSKPVSTRVGRSVDSQVHLDRLRQTAEVAEFESSSSRPQEETFTKTSKQLSIGDDLDDALVEDVGKACDSRVEIAREVTGNHRETVAHMLWQDFDEDSLREIDRLCGEREKDVSPSVAAKQVPSPVAYEGIQALQRDSNSGGCTGLSPQTSHMSRHSVAFDGDGAGGPESFSRSSKTVEAFKNLDVVAAGVEPARDMDKAIHDDGALLNAEEVMGVSNSCKAEGHSELPTYLQNLNRTQQEAASCDSSKPLLILAGPGSGKTSTMVARLLSILKEGVHPSNILAMTFTTAAATEMRERVGKFVGKKASQELVICTFHSFCLQLCREHAEKLGRTAEFIIYGRGQQRKAVIEATRLALSLHGNPPYLAGHAASTSCANMVAEDAGPAMWKDKAKKWQKFVTQAKAAGKTPEDYKAIGNLLEAEILRQYEATLAACNALDYHDFIIFAVKLLEKHPGVLEDCHKSWTYLLVDEFQDTSTMQYNFLKLIASHGRLTVVGDDDQSIFGFNGANATGFELFRKDFPNHSEIRLHQNYRSTRCIVEAAHSVIKNNLTRCPEKHSYTDNIPGDKIVVKECRTEAAQCGYVVDNIIINASDTVTSFGNTAILYRRQVTGKAIQAALRARKIPFNVHGVAFYRKKVVKNVFALFQTVLPGCKDLYCRRIFKALYAGDKEETKKVLEHVDKVATMDKQGFWEAAQTIFKAKLSGTFSRRQLALGRKVLSCIQTVKCLVHKEQSLSALITAVINLLPQRPSFESRAILDENGGKLLNEDYDSRTVADYFLDDVNKFLVDHFHPHPAGSIGSGVETSKTAEGKGCLHVLQAFLDYISSREAENFRLRREENKNSVTLTTMHQSKGLEWNNVYIVKANESETPLLHEAAQSADDSGSGSLEEERRLFYVGMTRARQKLYICYVVMDLQRQLLQPSRFIREIPPPLIDLQRYEETCQSMITSNAVLGVHREDTNGVRAQAEMEVGHKKLPPGSSSDAFLKGFSLESRSTVAGMFHTWAKSAAFQEPSRLLRKVSFVIDERLRNKGTKNKDVLRAVKCSLWDDEALAYALHVINWTKLPLEDRALLQAERQEHFQQLGTERAMGISAATDKQRAFLKSLGCTTEPTSRLHASRLIEQYKKL